MRTRTKLAVALSASALAVFGMAGPTSAAPTLDRTIAAQAERAGLDRSEVAELQRQIDRQMAVTPGGEQIGVNQVAWRGGKAVMTFPLPGEKQARAVDEPVGTLGTANCSYLWTCLYEHDNYDGRRLTWSDCAFVNLSSWDFIDKTSSWHNNQSSGTVTRVYNWTGSSWSQLWASTAPSRSSYVGNTNNDKADGIRVC
ncbi:peptidase inhibitor family I36 protein [Streptomyces sp. NPDC051742]|uniref:peptidase inhibitor family I36 protein n=1 Tax=unclassified Streptomyces TaxID=2593676 RepID=UPI003428F10C